MLNSDDDFEDLEEKNDNKIESQSDIKSEDTFNDEEDYYNDNNEEYKKAEPLPSIDPPKEISFSTRKFNDNRQIRTTKETFMNFDEKFQKMKNEDYNEDEFPTGSVEEMFESYKIKFNVNVDYSLTTYDIFSKNHLRVTLLEQIKKINWGNQIKIDQAKKETNAYEDIYEKYFNKNQSCQLANINYLFDKKLIEYDNFYNGIPILIVGDNGGFTDWIMYYTIDKKAYFPSIFVIPEKNNDIKKTKFRNQIKDKIQEHVVILDEFYQENKDIDENTNLSNDFINNISKTIYEKTDKYKVNLYIARKVIKFSPDSSQEIKYKKFLLVNTLLAFKTLNNGGNFIIKLYDTFTHFTVGLIYMIFKNFENVTIFKPVSTRQYSPCRFLVAENYLKSKDEETNGSIKYLEDFLAKYIEFTKNDYDVKFFLPSAELRKNEQFKNILFEINNGITEKRIDALKQIINYLDEKSTNLYDKMSIKKFFLDKWGIPVINYDENKILKKGGGRNYNNYQKKIYTEDELAEAYKDVGQFTEEQKKLLELMSKSNRKHKKKVDKEKKQNENPPENEIDRLKKIYERVDGKINMKKPTNRKKRDKENTPKKGKSKNNEYNKDNSHKKEKDKELLKKKTERSEDKKIEKKKKTNKYEVNEDKGLNLKEEESPKNKDDILKKLEKYKRKK